MKRVVRPGVLAVALAGVLVVALVASPAAAIPPPEDLAGAPATTAPPPPPCVSVPVDLALWWTISINARYAPCARNLLGLGFAGRAGELTGVQVGLAAYEVERDASGLQLAGGVGITGGAHTGLQLGGLGAIASGDVLGLQVGGLFAVGGHDVLGLQVGGLFAVADDDTSGLQVGGLFAVAGGSGLLVQAAGLFAVNAHELRGLQVSGLLGVVGNRMKGLQVAGGAGVVEGIDGAQVAGGLAWTRRGRGLQVAGGLARSVEHFGGVQVAVVNYGHDVDGAQIGVVNIARRVRGLQLGVVNIADHASAPVGLVSWMRQGERAVEAWGGEALPFAAGVRLGTRHVYSLVGLAGDVFHEGSPWGALAGVGVALPLGPIAVDLDGLAHALYFDGVDDQGGLFQTRLRLRVPVAPRLALTAGASWNVFVSDDVEGADLPLGEGSRTTSGDTVIRQWPGITAGVSIGW